MLQTRKRLLHSTAENCDFNMAGYAFQPVRDMPIVSDCHPVERDQFPAPAPPSDRVGVTGVRVGAAGAWTLPLNQSAAERSRSTLTIYGGIRLHNHA